MTTSVDDPLTNDGFQGASGRNTAGERTHFGSLHRTKTPADLATQGCLPALALALASFAGWYVWTTRPMTRVVPPPANAPRSPYGSTLACAGIVEARSENIAIGSPTAGVVVEVLVQVGDDVEAGAALFKLDDRELQGQLAVYQAALEQARNELLQLEAEPRRETLPPLFAAVKAAKAAYDSAADALRRAEELFAQKVVTEQEVIGKRDAAAFALATVEKAEAEVALREAGAWTFDLNVARAALAKAVADVQNIQIAIERLTIRTHVDGEVLQVNVRPGEFVGAPPGQALVVMGNVERLHIRVDIDEFEIGRFDPSAMAQASPRGSPGDVRSLRFVRVDPFVVPKKSLTGDNAERVDTRVLQVIYECDATADGADGQGRRLFVGQQVDVSIAATGGPSTSL